MPGLKTDEEKPNYTEFWQKYGGILKWSAVIANILISIIIYKELVALGSLGGGALAQWQLSIGAKFLFLSLPVSVFVFEFTLVSLRLNTFKEHAVRQTVFLLCAVSSLVLPIILFRNIHHFIK